MYSPGGDHEQRESPGHGEAHEQEEHHEDSDAHHGVDLLQPQQDGADIAVSEDQQRHYDDDDSDGGERGAVTPVIGVGLVGDDSVHQGAAVGCRERGRERERDSEGKKRMK